MTKETKDDITVWSAVCMLAFGVLITAAGFVVPPLGIISDSVLWVLGQCLLYSGSVFGVAMYIKNKISGMEGQLELRVREEVDKISN